MNDPPVDPTSPKNPTKPTVTLPPIYTVDSHFIDVEGGDCAIHILLTNNKLTHAVLIDGGRSTSAKLLSNKIQSLWARYGVNFTFDSIVVTHWDNDHYGGLMDAVFGDWGAREGMFVDREKTTFFAPRTGVEWSYTWSAKGLSRSEDRKRLLRGVVGKKGPGKDGPEKIEVEEVEEEEKSMELTKGQKSKMKKGQLTDGGEVKTVTVCKAVFGPKCVGYDLFTAKLLDRDSKSLQDFITLYKQARPLNSVNGRPPVFLCFGADDTFFNCGQGDPDFYDGMENYTVLEKSDVGDVKNGSSIMAVVVWPDAKQDTLLGGKMRVSLYTGGDALKTQEEALWKWIGPKEGAQIEVVKAGHHGSLGSSCAALFTYDPKAVVLCAGEGNGHPGFAFVFHLLVLAHYRNGGTPLQLLAFRPPYWFEKDENLVSSEAKNLNVDYVISYTSESIELAKTINPIVASTHPGVNVYEEWFGLEAIAKQRTATACMRTEAEMKAWHCLPHNVYKVLDKWNNTPKQWRYPNPRPTSDESLKLQKEVKDHLREVLQQKWIVYGNPKLAKRTSDIVIRATAQGIEYDPVVLVPPQKNAAPVTREYVHKTIDEMVANLQAQKLNDDDQVSGKKRSVDYTKDNLEQEAKEDNDSGNGGSEMEITTVKETSTKPVGNSQSKTKLQFVEYTDKTKDDKNKDKDKHGKGDGGAGTGAGKANAFI